MRRLFHHYHWNGKSGWRTCDRRRLLKAPAFVSVRKRALWRRGRFWRVCLVRREGDGGDGDGNENGGDRDVSPLDLEE